MSDETSQEPSDQSNSTPSDFPTTPMPPTPPVPASEAGATPTPPVMPTTPETVSGSKGKRTIALALAALLVLAGGGAAFAFFQLRGSSDSLMSQVPAGADVVATVYLNPAASQKVNLFRMTDQFPVLGSESDLTQRLNMLLDQVGRSVGLDHTDFAWIGSQAAVVVDFTGAVTPNIELLVNVDDVAAAKATVEKGLSNAPALGGVTWQSTQYKGVAVSSSSAGAGAYAFVGDTLVLGSTTTGVESIIDTDQGGASLADSADFMATSDGLPDARLAFVYVNVKTLLPLASSLVPGTSGVAPIGASLAGLQAIGGIGMTISAESNGLAMDFNESFDPSKLTAAQKALAGSRHDNPLTSYVPANALGVMQLEHLDAILNSTITQLEASNPSIASTIDTAGIPGPDGLISSLTGDMAIEIAPGTPALPVSGALVLGIKDTTKFDAAISKLQELTAATAPNWQTVDYKGTTINFTSDGGGPSVAYATLDGAGVIGIGPDSIKAVIDAKAGQNISSNVNFTTAQNAVPSQSEFVYLDVAGVLQAAAASSSDPTLSQAATVLKPIKAIAIGAETTTDHTHMRFIVLIP